MSSPLAKLAASRSAIAAMTDAEFDGYWTALGRVVRIAARAGHRADGPEGRDPASTTSATIERSAQWDHDRRAPASAAGIGFTKSRT